MQDALERQLEKGDVVVALGTYTSRVIIVTQSDPNFLRGLHVRFERNPTDEEQKFLLRRNYSNPDFCNVRYELKFGKVTCRRYRKLVKVTGETSEFVTRAMPCAVAYLHELTITRLKEVYRLAFEHCITQIKAGQAVKVPKELRYIEKCTPTP